MPLSIHVLKTLLALVQWLIKFKLPSTWLVVIVVDVNCFGWLSGCMSVQVHVYVRYIYVDMCYVVSTLHIANILVVWPNCATDCSKVTWPQCFNLVKTLSWVLKIHPISHLLNKHTFINKFENHQPLSDGFLKSTQYPTVL